MNGESAGGSGQSSQSSKDSSETNGGGLDGDTKDSEKRYDEDALPVPLEQVEMLTGGVDENDDRVVEFPWDEEARKARIAPRPIKFSGRKSLVIKILNVSGWKVRDCVILLHALFLQ